MDGELEARLATWVDAGLISGSQAAAIRAHERAGGVGTPSGTGTAAGAAPPTGADRRRSLLAEAMGYLGAALALIAGGLVLGEYWDQLRPWGRVVLTGTLTAVVAVAGALLRGNPLPPVQRLVGVLWFAASAGVAFTVGVGVDGLVGADDRDIAVAVTVSVLVVSAVLHRLWPRSLQLIALFGGVVGTAVAVALYPEAAVDQLFMGLLIWALGAAWVLLAAGGWVGPATTGQVLGLLALGVGAQITASGDSTAAGLGLALVSTVVVLAASVAGASTLLLAFAVAGVLVFVPETVFHFFGDSLGAPFALLLTGLLLVAAAVGLTMARREIAADTARDEEARP